MSIIYDVERSINGEPWTMVATELPLPTFTDTPTVTGDYEYRIRSYNTVTDITSEWSEALAFYYEAPVAGAPLEAWTGTAWVEGELERWDGTAWVPEPLERWDGTQWVIAP